MTMTDTALDSGVLVRVAADLIDAGSNDRLSFADADLGTLAASIARDGLAQPPTVRPVGDRFQIVAGERRVRAMRLLGWSTIPCFVRELDDNAAADVMLVENMVRVDLDPLEEAKAYRARLDSGATLEELSALVGVGQRTIRNRLDLLRLGGDAQLLISSGNLPLGHAGQMVGLDGDRQNLALRALAGSDIGLAAFTNLCDRLRREQETEPMFSADLFWSVEEYVIDAQREVSTDGGAMIGTAQAAALAGLKVESLRRLVCRGTFPHPDGHFGRTPWWYRSTVDAWQTTRRPSGRPSNTTTTERV